MNNRRDFLRLSGLAGAASLIPFTKSAKANSKIPVVGGGCTLIPSETAGPYPLDLHNNQAMFRTDIRESQEGIILNQKIKIVGDSNCLPIPNARVDVWQCSAHGYYSGYTTNAHQGTQNHVGETFLRGIQMTDANGEVSFTTIFPGWYPGRICHIHFQVFLSSVLQVTSQLTYPLAEKNALLTTHAPYTQYGADPQTFNSDGVFADGYALQLATLTSNPDTGGYDSYLEVTIDGTGTTALQKLEPETGGQFKLGQNYPNPFNVETVVPFTLKENSNVKLELYDLSGKKVATINRTGLNAGEHKIEVNLKDLDIPKANYLYQLEVENNNGAFRQCKMMTRIK
ncbi:MAG TPA: T9SS type A sorting domain-containing protein [Saprospiraceae bacterium]|nr:T9SS type A sorting domain-containing protein [Saprospiraceae bacterium]